MQAPSERRRVEGLTGRPPRTVLLLLFGLVVLFVIDRRRAEALPVPHDAGAPRPTGDTHPGPQERLRRPRWTVVLLFGLAALSIVLVAQALVRQNVHANGWFPRPAWEWKIVDASAAIPIALTLVSILIARQQLALGLRPYLAYSTDDADDGGTEVTLVNDGKGLAVMRRMTVTLEPRDTIGELRVSTTKADTLVGLRALDLEDDVDLLFLSAGAPVRGESEVVLCRSTPKGAKVLRRLDVALEFEGVLGDRYRKDVYCVPRAASLG